jgi:hypothetical protein
MKKIIIKLLGILIAVLIVLALIGGIFFFNGFVFMCLFNWFLTPLIKLKLSYLNACGIWTMAILLKGKYIGEVNTKEVYSKLVKFVTYPLVYLIIGYIIHLFML